MVPAKKRGKELVLQYFLSRQPPVLGLSQWLVLPLVVGYLIFP
jgi:hypothetical protein